MTGRKKMLLLLKQRWTISTTVIRLGCWWIKTIEESRGEASGWEGSPSQAEHVFSCRGWNEKCCLSGESSSLSLCWSSLLEVGSSCTSRTRQTVESLSQHSCSQGLVKSGSAEHRFPSGYYLCIPTQPSDSDSAVVASRNRESAHPSPDRCWIEKWK